MTKTALTGTSLVAAVPGGFLAYLTIRAFLDHADKMATMLQVVTGTTLLFSVLMALSPFAILLFVRTPALAGGPGKGASSVEPPAAAPKGAPAAAIAAAPMASEETLDEYSEATSDADFDSSDEVGAVDDLDDFETASEDNTDEGFEFEDDAFAIDDDDLK